MRRDALALQKSGDWDDAGPQLAEASGGISGGTALRAGGITSQDDEYRWAGVEDPKVMITTSRDPSARLKKFVKVKSMGRDLKLSGQFFSSLLISTLKINSKTKFSFLGIPFNDTKLTKIESW